MQHQTDPKNNEDYFKYKVVFAFREFSEKKPWAYKICYVCEQWVNWKVNLNIIINYQFYCYWSSYLLLRPWFIMISPRDNRTLEPFNSSKSVILCHFFCEVAKFAVNMFFPIIGKIPTLAAIYFFFNFVLFLNLPKNQFTGEFRWCRYERDDRNLLQLISLLSPIVVWNLKETKLSQLLLNLSEQWILDLCWPCGWTGHWLPTVTYLDVL